METRKTKLGADHPDTLTSMANLAFTWTSQDRYVKALALMESRVPVAGEKAYGPGGTEGAAVIRRFRRKE